MNKSDEAINRCGKELALMLAKKFLLAQMSSQTVHEIEQFVKDYRTHVRLHDEIDLPELVPLVLVEIGRIELVRRDLDDASIRQIIVNMKTKYPVMEMTTLVFAIRRAFPSFAARIKREMDRIERP